jgi:hypothetical protein
LSRICDIAAWIKAYQDVEWGYILEWANQLGIKRLILLSLLLAEKLLSTSTNSNIVQCAIEADSSLEKLVSKVEENLIFSGPVKEPGEVQRTFFHIQARNQIKDKIYSIWGLLNHSGWLNITQNDRDAFPLPSQLEFLYILLRPIRIINKYLLMER